jgi:hypothetical protein
MLIAFALVGVLAGQAPAPEVPVLKAGLGSCTVDFTVKNASGAPIQAAEIHVRIKYGAMGFKRMDLDLSTNADGKARIEGLPDKAKPFSYDIQKDGRKAIVVHDVSKVCRATHEVELK